jgi:hypothetical protein
MADRAGDSNARAATLRIISSATARLITWPDPLMSSRTVCCERSTRCPASMALRDESGTKSADSYSPRIIAPSTVHRSSYIRCQSASQRDNCTERWQSINRWHAACRAGDGQHAQPHRSRLSPMPEGLTPHDVEHASAPSPRQLRVLLRPLAQPLKLSAIASWISDSRSDRSRNAPATSVRPKMRTRLTYSSNCV